MNVLSETQVLLGGAGYATWQQRIDRADVVCFEDATLAGFVHSFATADELLQNWRERESTTLAHHAAALRRAGDKAWNLYTVLLCEQAAIDGIERSVLSIEEDLQLTRKIARSGIVSSTSLRAALLTLLPILPQALPVYSDFNRRLVGKLTTILSAAASQSLIGSGTPDSVARMVVDES